MLREHATCLLAKQAQVTCMALAASLQALAAHAPAPQCKVAFKSAQLGITCVCWGAVASVWGGQASDTSSLLTTALTSPAADFSQRHCSMHAASPHDARMMHALPVIMEGAPGVHAWAQEAHPWRSQGACIPTTTPTPAMHPPQVLCKPLCDQSLGFLSKQNLLRKQAIRLVHWKVFEWIALLAILGNSITLAMDRWVMIGYAGPWADGRPVCGSGTGCHG